MVVINNREKDDLLADLEASIEKALDARLNELVGALIRLQGSAHGWCGLSDCGGCALAPMKCISELDESVDTLVQAHHKAKSSPKPQERRPVHPSSPPEPTPIARNQTGSMTDTTIKRYASRIHRQLGSVATDFVTNKMKSIDAAAEPQKAKDWRRIRSALTTYALDQKFRTASKR